MLSEQRINKSAAPEVSVVIAAFNAERTLARSINSLVAQTYVSWEALIVDDASTDQTFSLAQDLSGSDPRIRAFRQERNRGPSATRNVGLRHAKGQWIAILDADDTYVEARLERLIAAASSGKWDVIFDNLGSAGHTASAPQAFWPAWRNKGDCISLREMLRGCSGTAKNPYGILKPFIRRSFLNDTGLAYDEEIRRGEDFLFYVSMMLRGARAGRVSEIGYLYERPVSVKAGNASLSNLEHSHLAALKVKRFGWHKMGLIEKFWLAVRILVTKNAEPWAAFREAILKRNVSLMLDILIRHPEILVEVLVKGLSRLIDFFDRHACNFTARRPNAQ